MPEVQLPIFPAGSVEINRDLACRTEGEQVVYYNGHLPVFTHAKKDLASFRLFTGQLIVQGSATQGDIAKAFGVPLVAIKRATKRFREHGAQGFFAPKPRREGSKLNARGADSGVAHQSHGHSTQAPSAKGVVNLAWADRSTNERGFIVERKTSTTAVWQSIATLAPNARSFSDTTVASRTTYNYRVKAFNVGGSSPFSNQVSASLK